MIDTKGSQLAALRFTVTEREARDGPVTLTMWSPATSGTKRCHVDGCRSGATATAGPAQPRNTPTATPTTPHAATDPRPTATTTTPSSALAARPRPSSAPSAKSRREPRDRTRQTQNRPRPLKTRRNRSEQRILAPAAPPTPTRLSQFQQKTTVAGKHAAGLRKETRRSAVTGSATAVLPRGQRLVGTKSYDGATSITLKSRSPEVDGAASVIVLV